MKIYFDESSSSMIDLGPKFGYLNLSSKAYKSDVFCDAVVANREISELEDMELKVN